MRDNIAKWLLGGGGGNVRTMLDHCTDLAFRQDIRERCVDLYRRRDEIVEADRRAAKQRSARLAKLGLKGVQTAVRCKKCRLVFVDHAACVRHMTDTHGETPEPVLVKLVGQEWIEVETEGASND